MDDQRALLDMLMGKSRNLPSNMKDKIQEISFHDKEVCKHFMCGLCPYLLFNATKSDLGRCPKSICDNSDAIELRRKYALINQKEKDSHGYEYELFLFVEDLVRQCDARIQRNKKRAEKDIQITEETLKKISMIEGQIKQLNDECSEAAENGDIDLSQEIAHRMEVLKTEINILMNPKDQKITTVCEVSGNFMSTRDNDERMRAHFEGKQYIGWKLIREKYKELKERNIPPPSSSRYKRSRSRSRERSEDRKGTTTTATTTSGSSSSENKGDKGSSSNSNTGNGNGSRRVSRRSSSRDRRDFEKDSDKILKFGDKEIKVEEKKDNRMLRDRSTDRYDDNNRNNNNRDNRDRRERDNRDNRDNRRYYSRSRSPSNSRHRRDSGSSSYNNNGNNGNNTYDNRRGGGDREYKDRNPSSSSSPIQSASTTTPSSLSADPYTNSTLEKGLNQPINTNKFVSKTNLISASGFLLPRQLHVSATVVTKKKVVKPEELEEGEELEED